LKRAAYGFALLLMWILICTKMTNAQSISGYFAGGTMTAPSVGPMNTLGAGTIYDTPKMGGFFETLGVDVIFFHNLGLGAELSTRDGRAPYAGLMYHPSFYDVNVVYRPRAILRRIAPEIQAGYGEANLNFYYTLGICYKLPQGCSSANGEAFSADNNQVHVSGGLRIYAYKGLFIRPQVDVRWVQGNFTTYFGRSWVPQYSAAIGYTYSLDRWRQRGK
jgi:hypothetical protein